MAFVVENGTGMSNANAYVDIAFATDYFKDKGQFNNWGSNTTLQQQAIVRATQYMDLRWGSGLSGYVQSKDPLQALAMPRLELYDMNGFLVSGIPANWKKACCEYALIALTTQLLPNPVQTVNGQTIIKKSETIGPIKRDFEFSRQNDMMIKPYPLADSLVRIYLRTRTGRVIR